MKKIILFLVFLSLCSFGLFADSYDLYSYNGGQVSYSQIERLPKAVLLFWTTRCPACTQAIKQINKNNFFPDDVKIIFINIMETKPRLEAYIEHLNLKAHIVDNIVVDTKGALADKFAIRYIPTNIFMKSGEVIGRNHALTEQSIKDMFGDD